MVRGLLKKFMNKFAFIYWVMLLISVEANAQKLWGDAVFGMTPIQIVENYPQALPLEVGPNNEYTSISMNFVALSEFPSTIYFKFWEQKLYGVDWKFKLDGSFDFNKPLYEELLNGIMKEYPDLFSLKQYRASEISETDRTRLLKAHVDWLDKMVRHYSDEWRTNNGTTIQMNMSESTRGGPVRIEIYTKNDPALKQLKAQSALLKQKIQEATNQTKIEEDQQRHSDFFEGFIGKNINFLANTIGAPTATTAMSKGEAIYVWEIFSDNKLLCKTSVFTKKNGLIYSWHWSGTYCRRKQ